MQTRNRLRKTTTQKDEDPAETLAKQQELIRSQQAMLTSIFAKLNAPQPQQQEPTRKRKRTEVVEEESGQFPPEDDRDQELSPSRDYSHEEQEQEDNEEPEDEDELPPAVFKDESIVRQLAKKPRVDIMKEVGSPWAATHLRDLHRQFEPKIEKGTQMFPIPSARPAEYEALKKPYNKALLTRFKMQKEFMKKLQRIFNVLIYCNNSHEQLWTKVYLATALQCATVSDDVRSIIKEAQGLKDHTNNDTFFTSDDEVEKVKDVQQQRLVQAAISRSSGSHSNNHSKPSQRGRGGDSHRGTGRGSGRGKSQKKQ